MERERERESKMNKQVNVSEENYYVFLVTIRNLRTGPYNYYLS